MDNEQHCFRLDQIYHLCIFFAIRSNNNFLCTIAEQYIIIIYNNLKICNSRDSWRERFQADFFEKKMTSLNSLNLSRSRTLIIHFYIIYKYVSENRWVHTKLSAYTRTGTWYSHILDDYTGIKLLQSLRAILFSRSNARKHDSTRNFRAADFCVLERIYPIYSLELRLFARLLMHQIQGSVTISPLVSFPSTFLICIWSTDPLENLVKSFSTGQQPRSKVLTPRS